MLDIDDWRVMYESKEQDMAKLRASLHDLEKRHEEAKLSLEVVRRDAERWNWAKENPRKACDIFAVEWMEQRDFDGVVDAAIAVIPPTNCRPKCTACGDQPLQVKQDQCGLPFCDGCYEEMRRGCNEE